MHMINGHVLLPLHKQNRSEGNDENDILYGFHIMFMFSGLELQLNLCAKHNVQVVI